MNTYEIKYNVSCYDLDKDNILFLEKDYRTLRSAKMYGRKMCRRFSKIHNRKTLLLITEFTDYKQTTGNNRTIYKEIIFCIYP